MKKSLLVILTLIMFFSSIGILPVSAQSVTYYVDQDFNSVEGGKQITVTNISTNGKFQYQILGEEYDWNSAETGTTAGSYAYAPKGDDVTVPTATNNNSGYIKGAGKSGMLLKMTMEMKKMLTQPL